MKVLFVLLALTAPASAGLLCAIDSSPTLAFGNYDVYNATPTDSASSISYHCTASISVTIDVSAGSSGTTSARTLVSGTHTVEYNVYTDAAHQHVWGDGTGGTSHYGPIGALLSVVTVPIYGRIPARQDVYAANNYADTIVVTMNF